MGDVLRYLVILSMNPLYALFVLALQTPAPTPTPKPTPPLARATIAWKTLVKRCSATATVAGGKTYLAHDRAVSCLDDAGHTLWSTVVGPNDAAPRVDLKRVYIGTLAGTLLALDRKSGAILWRFEAKNAIHSAAAVHGPAVFVESCDGKVYALEAASGTQLWSFTRPDGSLGYADPVPGGDTALFVCGETTLYRLDPLSGSLVWKTPMPGKGLATPGRSNGKLIVGGDGAGLSAISEDDGKRVWKFPASGKSTDWYGVPLVRDGMIYIGTVRGLVYAIDATTGRRLWAASLEASALARPTLDPARNAIWVPLTDTATGAPSLISLDSRTGKKRFELKLGDIAASPAIVGDRLYVGSLGGYYHAISLK